VDDICATRDQFAEVFGDQPFSQSAAAGASPIEQNNSTGQASNEAAREAPDGSSASGAGEMTDTATTTTPAPRRLSPTAHHLFPPRQATISG